jgi:hypothetical protein
VFMHWSCLITRQCEPYRLIELHPIKLIGSLNVVAPRSAETSVVLPSPPIPVRRKPPHYICSNCQKKSSSRRRLKRQHFYKGKPRVKTSVRIITPMTQKSLPTVHHPSTHRPLDSSPEGPTRTLLCPLRFRLLACPGWHKACGRMSCTGDGFVNSSKLRCGFWFLTFWPFSLRKMIQDVTGRLGSLRRSGSIDLRSGHNQEKCAAAVSVIPCATAIMQLGVIICRIPAGEGILHR